MKKMLFGAVAMSLVATPLALPTAAFAQNHGYDNHGGGDHGHDNRGGDNHGGGDRSWQGDRNGWNPQGSYRYDKSYKERRLGRNDRVYRGGDGRYYCKRNDGTTGLVIGAIGGGLLGNAIGGNTLGTLLGAGGGALLGRSVDRGNVRCR